MNPVHTELNLPRSLLLTSERAETPYWAAAPSGTLSPHCLYPAAHVIESRSGTLVWETVVPDEYGVLWSWDSPVNTRQPYASSYLSWRTVPTGAEEVQTRDLHETIRLIRENLENNEN